MSRDKSNILEYLDLLESLWWGSRILVLYNHNSKNHDCAQKESTEGLTQWGTAKLDIGEGNEGEIEYRYGGGLPINFNCLVFFTFTAKPLVAHLWREWHRCYWCNTSNDSDISTCLAT